MKAVWARLLYANLEASTSNGLASRRQTTAANERFRDAVSRYQTVIADASSVPGASTVLPFAYRSMGLFYYSQRDTRGHHCEAKAALEKYLELAPAASDRPMIADRLRDLSCTPLSEGSNVPRAVLPRGTSQLPRACPSGEYWSSVKRECMKFGE